MIAGDVLGAQLWIGGRSVDALDGATYDDVDPASGEVFARIASGGARDVDRALDAARRAFDSGPWPRTTVAERAKVLRKLGGLLVDNREELARLESRDAGKPFRETADRDVPRAADNCAFFASAIEQREQSAFFDRKPFLGAQREIASIVREEPVGVCALLTPWNSPLMQATWKIAPAIAAGNTCVLKPSELTPLSTLRLAELCTEAGVPDGVVNVVTGFGPAAGAPLVADPRVDAVAFTGSEPTGIAINVAAAATLKKITLELGGKSANVVCDDADLELAVEGSVLAMFRHSGQVCLAGTRLYVQSGIYDRFIERYLERVRALRVGDPQSRESDLGPLITPQHRERVERFCAQAAAEGVEALLRGARPDDPALARGNYLGPTIFAPRDESQAIASEEVFGPVLSVFRFDTLDEVIARANATRFGLSAYIWTANVTTGLRFAHGVRAGMCWINGYFLRDLRQPFGGVGMSGLGREGGRWSLDFFTEPKLVCISY
ncbi:MAG: betaine-aldehyde dehydrogenase [Candidatus Eremiobacteraeota bacterium]|nr:betaine-aldehyde dehydrogenase [Candidatus Eremiobacteraeota bacterium]